MVCKNVLKTICLRILGFEILKFLEESLSTLNFKSVIKYICLTSLTRAKYGVRSTLCWKIPNISGSIQLFAL